MEWVSFDEIKKTVTLQMVIDHYGIPLRRVGPDTLRGKCPLPTHNSKTSTESFTATLSKGVGGAWACQSQSCIESRGRVGGNVLDFVAAMENCSVRDAAIKLQMLFLVPAAGAAHRPAGKEPEAPLVAKNKNEEAGESEFNKPLSFTLQKIDYTHPYLYERGLTDEIIQTFSVGVFPGKPTSSCWLLKPRCFSSCAGHDSRFSNDFRNLGSFDLTTVPPISIVGGRFTWMSANHATRVRSSRSAEWQRLFILWLNLMRRTRIIYCEGLQKSFKGSRWRW